MRQLTPEEIEILDTVHVGDYVIQRYGSAIFQVLDIIEDRDNNWHPFKVRLKKITDRSFKCFKKQREVRYLENLFGYCKLTPEVLDKFRDACVKKIDLINDARKLL